MKVGIVCFNQNHYEYVLTLLTYFTDEGAEVSVYSNTKLGGLLQSLPVTAKPDIHLILANDGEKEIRFLKAQLSSIQSLDVTVYDEFFNLKENWRFLAYRIDRKKSWLTIHSANSWFKPSWSMSVSLIARTLVRKLIGRKFNNVVVFLDNIKNHIESETKIRKRVMVLPFSLPVAASFQEPYPHKGRVQLVTPGMVDPSRRNYDRILDAMETFTPSSCPFALTFLGRANGEAGKRVLVRCEEMVRRGYEIVTFSSFVPTALFDEVMLKADLIFSDVQSELVRDGTVEFYGKTKDTGVTYLMTKYSIPAVLPAHFRSAAELMDVVIPFQDKDELSRVLGSLSSETTAVLRARARTQSTLYLNRLHENFRSEFSVLKEVNHEN